MGTFERDGTAIHYSSTGTGEAVVFIAGMSLGCHVWDPVIETVGKVYRCIAVDPRGSGSSAAPRGPYTIETMAVDLDGLLDHLDVEQAVIVGHSMGGFVAMETALSFPKRVRSLVLVSTAASGDPTELGTTPEAAKALLRTGGKLEEIFRGMLEVGIDPGVRDAQPERIDALVKAHLAHPPRGRGFAGQRAAVARFDAKERLSSIACPCLVLHGQSDALISHQTGKALANRVKGARFHLLDGVGHFPQVEASRRTAEAICELARLHPGVIVE